MFWSSLARYYYFITSGSWGLWHDEIHLEHVEEMPILFPTDAGLRRPDCARCHGASEPRRESRKGWGSVRPAPVDGFRNLNENWMMWSTTCTGSTSPSATSSTNCALSDWICFIGNGDSEAVGDVARPDRSVGHTG